MNKDLELHQFINLLNFIALMSSSTYVLGLSPDYIVEKYKRYINNDINTISNESNKGGIHPIVIRDVIEPYIKRWMPEIINMEDHNFWEELK